VCKITLIFLIKKKHDKYMNEGIFILRRKSAEDYTPCRCAAHKEGSKGTKLKPYK